ncbi:A disintegrin and metalloproteinase with thrombospondin motifs 3 [Balamuthia mandrillaris]
MLVLARLQPAGVSRYEVIEPRWSRGNGHVSLRDLDSSDFSDALSFDAFEQKFQFNLRPNTDLFAPTYKELQMAEEGFIERGSKLHRACFLRSRPSNDSNFATINACAGDGYDPYSAYIFNTHILFPNLGLNSGISGVIKAYEEEYRLEAISTDLRNFEGSVRSTIIYRTSDMTVNHEGHCGLNHYHHLEDVGVDETVSSIVRSVEESHVQRNQADEGCIKYVGILAINDFSRYQAKGNHVEEDTVEIMSYVKGRFNHQVVQWNCKIEVRYSTTRRLQNR